ncbi:MAG: PEP-CTERM sorting domain-containing protein [Acidobacteria bacterium]|nr:PEP-CTERM sorting domain-containing protein [Acidobacteriota bacterium]
MSILRTFALMAVATGTASAGTILFTFDTDSTSTATTFTDTASGLSATFSSPADPGGFTIFPSFFASLTGNILLQDGSPVPLTIDFSDPLSSLTLLFATATLDPVSFQLIAYNSGTEVGTVSAVGGTPPGTVYPEGSISFSGVSFDRVVLSTPSSSVFAIDNVSATVGQVPEPASFLLIGLGLASVAIRVSGRRR